MTTKLRNAVTLYTTVHKKTMTDLKKDAAKRGISVSMQVRLILERLYGASL